MAFQIGGEVKEQVKSFQQGDEVAIQQRGGIESEPVPPEADKSVWLRGQIESGNIEPVPETFWEKFRQDIPQMAGGTAGSLAGARIGAIGAAKIPVGHPVLKGITIVGGAVVGAIVGGAGGKGYQQFYRITRPGAKPQTLDELYTEQIIAGIEEGASELAGRGIAKVGGKLLAPAKKHLIPGAKGLSKKLSKFGAFLTPAQATESRIIDTLEGVSESAFFGGGKLQRLKKIAQPEAFKGFIDDIVNRIGKGVQKNLSPEDVGDLLLDTIQGKRTAFKATAKAAYNKVDKLTAEARVSTLSLKKFASDVMKTAKARKGIGSSQAGDSLLNKILKLDDLITFKQAQGLRSALMSEQAAMGITKDKAIGLAKHLTGLTSRTMEEGALSLSDDALKAWKVANKFYRTGQETFNSKIIKTLTKTLAENPEVAVKKIFRPGASKQIKIVKNLVDKQTWKALKTTHLEFLLSQSADADKVILGKSFLNRFNKIGEATLKEIYKGDELASIRSIGELGRLLQRPTGGSGGMLIQLTQAGAVLNLSRMAFGGAPVLAGETGAILIGPPILSRMLANPTWSKWLSSGFQLPRHMPAASALATRLLRTTTQIKRELQNEARQKAREDRIFGTMGMGAGGGIL